MITWKVLLESNGYNIYDAGDMSEWLLGNLTEPEAKQLAKELDPQAATLIEQLSKEVEANVLNICQQQHTISEQAKEIDELKKTIPDSCIQAMFEAKTMELRTQNERLVRALDWSLRQIDVKFYPHGTEIVRFEEAKALLAENPK